MDRRTDFRIAYDRFLQSAGTVYGALFEAIREAIAQGKLENGARLPSSRQLASWYGISRGSVNAAYDMLLAEGYVRTEVGRGTFVDAVPSAAAKAEAGTDAIPLSDWAHRLGPVPAEEPERQCSPAVDLRIGLQDPRIFPLQEWKSALYSEIRDSEGLQTGAGLETAGDYSLREAIALYLKRERGIAVSPGLIAVTNGSMQAIALLSLLLIRSGEPVVIENPSYQGIGRAVKAAGGKAVLGEVDKDGIIPEDWASRLLFTTPGRQFPTGAVLPYKRRLQLLEWAHQRDAVIIEDDYDSEFRWSGRPGEPLKALDRGGRVVYLGTFSKTMPSSVRIGYAVLPTPLAEPFRKAKYLFEPHPAAIAEQRALARFMASGSYGRHLRRMRRECGRRLFAFRSEIQPLLDRLFMFHPAESGLHVCAFWKGRREDYNSFREQCGQAGIFWSDGDKCWHEQKKEPLALFGFAHLNEFEISMAAQRFKML